MKRLLIGICVMLLQLPSNYSTASDASVNPPPGPGKTKCTVSSDPSANVGYCVRFFSTDTCTPKTSGSIGPNCDGTVTII